MYSGGGHYSSLILQIQKIYIFLTEQFIELLDKMQKK